MTIADYKKPGYKKMYKKLGKVGLVNIGIYRLFWLIYRKAVSKKTNVYKTSYEICLSKMNNFSEIITKYTQKFECTKMQKICS